MRREREVPRQQEAGPRQEVGQEVGHQEVGRPQEVEQEVEQIGLLTWPWRAAPSYPGWCQSGHHTQPPPTIP